MPPLRPRKKSKFVAPASVHFASALNEKKVKQICVYVQCQWAETVVGPVWSHTQQSVDRALATLSARCECGRKYHKAREFTGHRVSVPARKAPPA